MNNIDDGTMGDGNDVDPTSILIVWLIPVRFRYPTRMPHDGHYNIKCATDNINRGRGDNVILNCMKAMMRKKRVQAFDSDSMVMMCSCALSDQHTR